MLFVYHLEQSTYNSISFQTYDWPYTGILLMIYKKLLHVSLHIIRTSLHVMTDMVGEEGLKNLSTGPVASVSSHPSVSG